MSSLVGGPCMVGGLGPWPPWPLPLNPALRWDCPTLMQQNGGLFRGINYSMCIHSSHSFAHCLNHGRSPQNTRKQMRQRGEKRKKRT